MTRLTTTWKVTLYYAGKIKKVKPFTAKKSIFFQLLHIVDEFADDCFQVNLALLGKIVKPTGFNLG